MEIAQIQTFLFIRTFVCFRFIDFGEPNCVTVFATIFLVVFGALRGFFVDFEFDLNLLKIRQI
jgi:hypothetical protein